MDASATTAAWLSFLVTAVGLGSLMTQANAIRDQMDHFHAMRDRAHLGLWVSRQPNLPWYRFARSSPVGPLITAKLTEGVGGHNNIYVSRLPMVSTGQASWTTLLATYHDKVPIVSRPVPNYMSKEIGKAIIETNLEASKSSFSWHSLPIRSLVRHGSTACTVISRTTLITLLSICNARQVFRYSDASGHRAAYGSYCGNWHVEWPLGGPAVVHLSAHDSHSIAADVYPPFFQRRVDKCIQITAGVIVAPAPSSFKCAFPGRKLGGRWLLDYQPKGFPGAHGSRHLYNMMGGKVYEVDFLFTRRLAPKVLQPENSLELCLPSIEKDAVVIMYIPVKEGDILAQALDCLPWTPLSWSVHRGLRDILITYAKCTMDRHREILAEILRQAATQQPDRLEAQGWEPAFVINNMPDIAANTVLAGGGNSGDSIRILTDVALLLWNGTPAGLDETTFWRERRRMRLDKPQYEEEVKGTRMTKDPLSPQAIIALVKCVVLEWSVEFDYQMYHDIPQELYFG